MKTKGFVVIPANIYQLPLGLSLQPSGLCNLLILLKENNVENHFELLLYSSVLRSKPSALAQLKHKAPLPTPPIVCVFTLGQAFLKTVICFHQALCQSVAQGRLAVCILL